MLCPRGVIPHGVEVCVAFILLLLQHQNVCCYEENHASSEPQMDLLLPYSNGFYDKRRTHRYVRDCLKHLHDNTTFETIKPLLQPDSPTIDVHYFRYRFSELHPVASGHLSFADSPLKTLSVLEPMKAHTCGKTAGVRARTSDSALQRNCIVATNAGFFNTRNGACIGNIISDGRFVQDSGGIQNANFGIRQDGTIVVGYLNEDDVLSNVNPFVQLISGVGWLLRDGELFLDESMKAECADTQLTGSMLRFFTVRSARTAIGHDALGRIVLAQVDGKTDSDGMNLNEFATFLKSNGVVNAINLDGGGSATYVINGSVVNYPSDKCTNLPQSFQCERPVSTIVCLHYDISSKDSTSRSMQAWSQNISLILVLSSVLAVSVILNICYVGGCKMRSSARHNRYTVRDVSEEHVPLALEEY